MGDWVGGGRGIYVQYRLSGGVSKKKSDRQAPLSRGEGSHDVKITGLIKRDRKKEKDRRREKERRNFEKNPRTDSSLGG